mmetsp:Transcript_19029/g.62025  ORF Transcript_19029/g.62025 Transcript_19029/m.62025 type:complete len:142 (+) Transcript_19029:169-594(+)
MKPAWDELGAKYASSASVLIADVDCTVETDLCSDYDVRGYPTIKYFSAETSKKGDAYSGGRTFDALDEFVEETLLVKCDVKEPSSCSEKEQTYIKKMTGKSKEEYASQIARLEKMSEGKMTPDLMSWLVVRLHILRQLSEA